MARPGPAGPYVWPAPVGQLRCTFALVWRMYHDAQRPVTPEHVAIVGLGALEAAQIQVAAVCLVPGVCSQKTCVPLCTYAADPRFSQVVKRRPYKVTDYIIEFLDAGPVLERLHRRGFGSVHHPLRAPFVVGPVLALQVVVSKNVQGSADSVGLLPWPGVMAGVQGRGYGSGRIERVYVFYQRAGYLGTARASVALSHFVAYAPHDDAGMVAVAVYHALNIALPPIVKGCVVIIGVLADAPAIKGLINDQQA